MAIVMAVFLKYFIVEAYKIPTGSMQPTLMGWKSSEHRRQVTGCWWTSSRTTCAIPERWEIAVFKLSARPLTELHQAHRGGSPASA